MATKKLSPRLSDTAQIYARNAVDELEKQLLKCLNKLSDNESVLVIEELSKKMIEKGFVTSQDLKESPDVISCLMYNIRSALESSARWADKDSKLKMFLNVFREMGDPFEEVATSQFEQTVLSAANKEDNNTNSLDDNSEICIPGSDGNFCVKPVQPDETNPTYSAVRLCVNENRRNITTQHPTSGTLSCGQPETTRAVPQQQQAGKVYNIIQTPIISSNFSFSPSSVYKRQQSCPDCIATGLKKKIDEDKDRTILKLKQKVNKQKEIIEDMNKETKQREQRDKDKFEAQVVKLQDDEKRLSDEKKQFRIIRKEEEEDLRFKRQESEKEKEKYKRKYKEKKVELAKAFEDEKAKSNKELEEKWKKKYEERLRENQLEDN